MDVDETIPITFKLKHSMQAVTDEFEVRRF